jgi:hypothetical protein
MELSAKNSSCHKINTFMIFGILLVGTFFILSLLTVDAFYSIGFIEKITTLFNKLNLEDKSLVIVLSFVTLSLYTIGFFIYISSFVLLSAPSWLLMTIIFKKNLFTENITEKIFSESNNLKDYQDGKLFFKRGFLYFLLRNTNNTVSSDIKFTFTQLMYARSVLLTIVLSIITIFCLKDNVAYIFLFGGLSYFIAIYIYAIALKFFDDILSMGYLSNKLTIDKTQQNCGDQ